MPSSRALVVKSLDVRRRTEAPHSGEAAMLPEKSGKHDGGNKQASQPASQPATAWKLKSLASLPLPGLASGLSVCLPLAFHLAPSTLFTSHISLLAHPTLLQLFNPSILSRDTTSKFTHLPPHQYFISHPPAPRACDLRSHALLPSALACTPACIYAAGPLLLYPSASSTPSTRALALRLHFHTHVQLRR
jgi:hypothetical protein